MKHIINNLKRKKMSGNTQNPFVSNEQREKELAEIAARNFAVPPGVGNGGQKTNQQEQGSQLIFIPAGAKGNNVDYYEAAPGGSIPAY